MEKIREIIITQSKGSFSLFTKPFKSSKNYDFSGISTLRKLLSNEKARILHVIKTQSPKSIYDLAKKLGRNFKSVNEDVKFLEKIGFIDLIEEKNKKRKRFIPKLITDKIIIHFKV